MLHVTKPFAVGKIDEKTRIKIEDKGSMAFKKNEFEKDLEIDPLQLDVMAGMQGELFFKWAEKATVAREMLDRAKLRLDVTEARMTYKARLDPDSYGIVKATDKACENAVKKHPKYLEVYEEWIKAKKDWQMAEKAVEAMEQRKRMLEILVTLHGQQYFAGPSIPRNLAEAFSKVRKEKTRKRKIRQAKKIRIRSKEGENNY